MIAETALKIVDAVEHELAGRKGVAWDLLDPDTHAELKLGLVEAILGCLARCDATYEAAVNLVGLAPDDEGWWTARDLLARLVGVPQADLPARTTESLPCT